MILECKIKEVKEKFEEFQCTKCDFQTNSDQGMQVHMTRKHTQSIVIYNPKKCDLCEKQYRNWTEFKHHMKTQSYKAE